MQHPAPRKPDAQQPSIGRIVHYVSYGTPGGEFPQQCRVAIITEVGETPEAAVSLAVVNPGGMFFDQKKRYDPEGAGGTWHWPQADCPWPWSSE